MPISRGFPTWLVTKVWWSYHPASFTLATPSVSKISWTCPHRCLVQVCKRYANGSKGQTFGSFCFAIQRNPQTTIVIWWHVRKFIFLHSGPSTCQKYPKMRSCSSNPGSANLFQLRTLLGLAMGAPNPTSQQTNLEIDLLHDVKFNENCGKAAK